MKNAMAIFYSLALFACEGNLSTGESPNATAYVEKTYCSVVEPIEITLLNNTNSSFSLESWDGRVFYYRDRLTDTGWVSGAQTYTYDYLSSQHDTIFIMPFSSYKDSLFVRKPGIYRYRFPIRWDANQPDELITNPFQVYHPY